jgi:chorismate-pyruvate lyase
LIAETSQTTDLLYPLSLFRERDDHPLPIVQVIEGEVMPEPQRRLLVHRGDMTSRLEEFYRAPMKLRVLHVEQTEHAYRREVILCARDTGLPVEYGAIEINLDAFAEPLRSEIVEATHPLGGLLNRHGLRYHSEPRAYLRLLPDLTLCKHFGGEAAAAFFGRCNILRGESGTVLARIVEVLRP